MDTTGDTNDHITPDELAAAVRQARADSTDGSVNMTALIADLEARTGRTLAPTETWEIDDPRLPAAVRELGARMVWQSHARIDALIAEPRENPMPDRPDHITPDELGRAVTAARAASLDGSVNMTALLADLETSTGRTTRPAEHVSWDDPTVPPQARQHGQRMKAAALARLEVLGAVEERGRRTA